METKKAPATVDDYIAQYDGEVKKRLQTLRKTIKKAAPAAAETISWGMPTYKLHGNLVHFAAGKNHIGFHPAPSGVEHFLQLADAPYKSSKGTVQLPHARALPLDLVERVVLFRVAENEAAAAEKASK